MRYCHETFVETKIIKQEIEFAVPATELFELIMDEKKHSAFTGEHCTMVREPGGVFHCYGDYIEGKNVTITPNKKIVQQWRGKDFPKGHFSTVTLGFEETNGKTTLHLLQEGVPAELAEHIAKGWYEHYWDKMKLYLASKAEATASEAARATDQTPQ